MEEIKFNITLGLTEVMGMSLVGKKDLQSMTWMKIKIELQKKVAEGYDIEIDPETLLKRHQMKVIESPNNHYAANFIVTLFANKKPAEQLYCEQFDYFINR